MSRIETAMEKAALLREGAPNPCGRTLPEQPETGSAAAELPPSGHCLKPLSPTNPLLVNLLDPHSPAAEEYRKLKAVLVKQCDGGQPRNLAMVTSSLPGEGKTLTALNLAISLAQGLDHTVLLVDADLRRPSLHQYLEIEQGPGLSDVLQGHAELAETIVATGLGRLSVIRAGTAVDNPVELFSSNRMRTLMEQMKHRYPDRFIILDTPPLVPFAESRTLAQIVDCVLFVTKERLAPQNVIREALDSIKGSSILGMVYNAAEICLGKDHYSYYKKYRSNV